MSKILATLGRARTATDGCRRYLPIAIRFDTRSHILQTKIEEDWDNEVRRQWTENQRLMREAILHEYGVESGDRKIVDFKALGPAPWSVAAPHNDLLIEARRAFVFGVYYSSLLGIVGLGERILNDLILTLRDAHADNPATKRVAKKDSIDKWDEAIRALTAWQVLDQDNAKKYRSLAKLRNDAVHYRRDIEARARSATLEAMELLTHIINHIFAPIGGPPRFIAGTAGNSFLTIASESHPLVQKYFIPSSVLVSPDFEFRNSILEVWDEQDYGAIHSVDDLTDEEFVAHLPSSRRSTSA